MKVLKWSICLMISIVLTGCWSYRDMDKIRVATGIAIDYDAVEDQYITTIEIANPSENEITSNIIQTKGELPFTSIRNAIMQMGKKLYWPHSKVVIISQEVASKKIIPIADLIHRDAEIREDTHFLVSKEKTAQEILMHKKKNLVNKITAYHLDHAIDADRYIGSYHCAQAWEFIKDLYEEKINPTLPCVSIQEASGNTYPSIDGLAVFKNDKFLGFLNQKESQTLLWLDDHIRGGLIVVPVQYQDESTKVTLDILKGFTKIKPIYKNEKLLMRIDVDIDVNIGEIDGVKNYISQEGQKVLKKASEKEIKKRILHVIDKMQHEYHSDVFRFSRKMKNQMPRQWKKINNHWDEIFPRLMTDIHVNIHLKESSLLSKAIEVNKI